MSTTTTIQTTDNVGTMPTTVISVGNAPVAVMPASFNRAEYIAQYNATGSPKQRKVPCTTTGQMVTIFGANLKSRIAKYGSVEAFLDGFVSRKAASKKFKQTV
jgi:hypothetical protein